MVNHDIRNRLASKGLKITPQRMAILDAIETLHNHPTAEQIIGFIRENYPNIATGTVYNILETLVARNIIVRVKSDRDIMRYDADTSNHHHLYCTETDSIADYYDQQLSHMLLDYFRKVSIPGFKVEDIKLQITGKCTQQ